MQGTRIEKDLLGEREIPSNVLWGIHTCRSIENFPISGRKINPDLIHAYGAVKLACAITNHELGKWTAETFSAIEKACTEMMEGKLDEHIIVDALQGGAGTSTNMNVNEVLANRALQILGFPPGSYHIIHPIEDINYQQSTNDTYPTALRVAAIWKLRLLEKSLVLLLESFQKKEKEFHDIVKVGRTEMQDAVLTTMGRTFSAFAEAIGRDRWRIYKCEERLRVINLGGTAIGTGIGAVRKYIFRAAENLRKITGIGLSRAENLVEATQNCDALLEVSGILKTCAGNLLKICSDIRFMSSGPSAGIGELILPPRQAGSTIMPGKVNPVIPESVSQAAISCIANDIAITIACSSGNLELNAFLPLIADRLLELLDILERSCRILAELCIDGIKVNEDVCKKHVGNSTACLTALISKIGYVEAQKIAVQATKKQIGIREAAIETGKITEAEFDELVSPQAVNRLGSNPT
ncbi:MAG: aspartate ammonia-lyase [Candidatus Nanoarchaeia archaeon]